MAALPPADGVAKVTFAQECSGRVFGTKLYVRNATITPWTLADLNTLANGMTTVWQTTMATYQDPPVILSGVIVEDLSSAMGMTAEHVAGSAGTFAGTEMLPLNCQARITYPTSYRYRGGRPGFNLTGIDRTAMADERSLETSTVYALIALADLIINDYVPGITLSTGDPEQVLVSYFTEHALRAVPLVTKAITSEVQQRLCTLRKRLGKGEAG